MGCHKKRVALNAKLQGIYKEPGAIWVEPGPSNAKHNVPQKVWLWLDQDLICSVTGGGLRSQWTYKVVDLNPHTAVLEAPDGRRIERLPLKKVAVMLNFARTYHAAQGLEFDRVRLWGWSAPMFSLSHLLVGISRSRAQLDFGPR